MEFLFRLSVGIFRAVEKSNPPRYTCRQELIDSYVQWRGGSEAAGEAPRIMAPPQSCFLSLGLGRVLCRRHNMQ